MKCEKCLYRKNCQFLATHKKSIVEDCMAFRSEEQYAAKIRAEAIKEVFDELEVRLAVHAFKSESEDYADGQFDCMEWVDGKIDELKKEMGCWE